MDFLQNSMFLMGVGIFLLIILVWRTAIEDLISGRWLWRSVATASALLVGFAVFLALSSRSPTPSPHAANGSPNTTPHATTGSSSPGQSSDPDSASHRPETYADFPSLVSKRYGPVLFWSQIGALAFLLVVCLLFLILFFRALLRGDTLGIESNLGGLGGSLGGWRISQSMSCLIGLLASGALLSVLLLSFQQSLQPTQNKPLAPQETPKSGEAPTPKSSSTGSRATP